MSETVTEPRPPGDSIHPDNPDALALAYAEVASKQAYFLEWSDAVATRSIGLFSVASLVVTLVPALAQLHVAGPWRLVWLLALLCWAGASIACFIALHPTTLLVSPEPSALLDPRWTTLSAPWYHRYRLEEFAEISAQNRPTLCRKAAWLKRALLLTGLEVLALALLVYRAN
jgi:hypothetical protein